MARSTWRMVPGTGEELRATIKKELDYQTWFCSNRTRQNTHIQITIGKKKGLTLKLEK